MRTLLALTSALGHPRRWLAQVVSAGLATLWMALAPSVAGAQNQAVLVRELSPGINSSLPSFTSDLNGLLMFGLNSGSDATTGLWRSDGTHAGTVLVRQGMIFPYYDAETVNGVLLVTASDTAAGTYGLWRSDGTAAGTYPLTTFSPSVRGMAKVGGYVYFVNSMSPQLWRTDGTIAGTQLVWTLTEPNAYILTLLPAASVLYLETGDPYDGATLHVTSGTPGSSVTPLRVFPDGNLAQTRTDRFSDRHYRNALAIGNRLFFSQYTAAHGTELWTSDGTVAGTVEIELTPNTASTAPTSFEAIGNLLTFGSGRQLWRSDGTLAGTVALDNNFMVGIAQGTDADSVALGPRVILTGWGTGPGGGLGLYSHDGSPATAQHLSTTLFDFFALTGHSYALTTDRLYARAFGGGDVWRTDGTSAGTVLVGSTYPGGSSDARSLVAVGGALFFWGSHPTSGFELYRIGMPISLPVAVADAYTTSVGTVLNVPATGVLANDLPNGGGTLSAARVAGPSHGSLSLVADGSFTYGPNAGFVGTDSFTYRATNLNGAGTTTVTIAVQSTPTTVQPPTELVAHTVVGNLVTLRWTAPTTGPAPTSYTLEGGVVPGDVLASIPTGSAVPLFAFAAPNGAFYLRMHTQAGSQRSVASNEIRVFVNQPVAPSAPSHLLGLVNGSAVALSWRPTFGGGTAASYVLDVSGTVNASLPVGLADSFTFNGVPDGSYTFRVRAVNAFGASGASSSVPLAFPGPCTGAPQSPADFLAYRVGNTVHLLWNPAAAGPAQTSFVLNVTGAINLSLPLPTRGISAPVPSGSYTFTVAAANACGTSAATAAQTVVIP